MQGAVMRHYLKEKVLLSVIFLTLLFALAFYKYDLLLERFETEVGHEAVLQPSMIQKRMSYYKKLLQRANGTTMLYVKEITHFLKVEP